MTVGSATDVIVNGGPLPLSAHPGKHFTRAHIVEQGTLEVVTQAVPHRATDPKAKSKQTFKYAYLVLASPFVFLVLDPCLLKIEVPLAFLSLPDCAH